jgi:hypothetical protein
MGGLFRGMEIKQKMAAKPLTKSIKDLTYHAKTVNKHFHRVKISREKDKK